MVQAAPQQETIDERINLFRLFQPVHPRGSGEPGFPGGSPQKEEAVVRQIELIKRLGRRFPRDARI
jgi:hypothetical protein